MAVTLTGILRGLGDDDLVALLRRRPDLMVPVPADFAALTARVQSRMSVVRAVDQLDRFHLQVLDMLRLTRDEEGIASLDRALGMAAVPAGGADAVRTAVDRLRRELLVFGPDDRLRLVDAVDDAVGRYPAGLGRPAAELDSGAAALVADPAGLRRTVLSAPPRARAVLERLATAGPVGTFARSVPGGDGAGDRGGAGHGGDAGGGVTVGPLPAQDADAEQEPVEWLVQHRLLVALSETSVELPREVGMLLRREHGPLGEWQPVPPVPASAPLDPATVDAAGAGQAMEVVRHTEALLEALSAEPAPVRRDGGVGVRELRRLARATGLAEQVVALLVETAYAAGLAGDTEGDTRSGTAPQLRPAAGYDRWRNAPLADQWHTLASNWLAMGRAPGLVGRRGTRDRPAGALGPEVERTGAPALRRLALSALASLPSGTAPTPEELLASLTWRAPRRVTGHEPAVRDLLEEAATLGVTGRGALTSYGGALLTGATTPPEPEPDPLGVHAGADPSASADARSMLERLLPEPVAEVMVQADLTVVVPGPPEPTLASELELVTEPESAGGGSVHRVTRQSVRHALDAGYAADDLHALFAKRSRTPVPQALTYLIDDVARAHGGLRAGSAASYLRCEDEALLTQVLVDRRLAPLGLRRLAPTVLASGVPVRRLLSGLRDVGYAPVPEDGSGAPVLSRPRGARASARTPVTAGADPFAASRAPTARLRGVVEDIRRGEKRARTSHQAPPEVRNAARLPDGQAHTDALALLQQAARDRALVWVGYLDAHGSTASRLLRPVSVGAGYLRAESENAETLHTVALHRITGAAPEKRHDGGARRGSDA